MSGALVCDNCGDQLILDGPQGQEDAEAESGGWIRVGPRGGEKYDACTRSCATTLLADDGPIAVIEAQVLAENGDE